MLLYMDMDEILRQLQYELQQTPIESSMAVAFIQEDMQILDSFHTMHRMNVE